MNAEFAVTYELESIPTAPSERSGHVCVSSNKLGCMFVVGGLGFQDQLFNDVWSFHPPTRRWTQHDTGGRRPNRSFGAAGCLLRDERTLFVSGGLSHQEHHLRSAHLLNLETFQWTELDSTNLQPNWGSSAVSLIVEGREKIFVFGGMHNDVCIQDILVWDTTTWSLSVRLVPDSCQMPLRRRHAATSYRDQFMIVFGGRNQVSFFNDMWAYNALIDEWAPLAASSTREDVARFFSHPCDRSHAARLRELHSSFSERRRMPDYYASCLPRTGVAGILVHNRYFVFFGGFLWAMQHAFSFDDLHVYDVHDHCWRRMVEVPKERVPPRMTMCGLCLVPGERQTLLLCGGRIEDVPTRTLFRLALQFPPPPSLRSEAKLWCRCLPDHCVQQCASTVHSALAQELLQAEPREFAHLYFRLHDEDGAAEGPEEIEFDSDEGNDDFAVDFASDVE